MRALVVDDSKPARSIVARALRDLAFECSEATNGAEALEAVAAEQQGTIDNTIELVRDTVQQMVPQAGGLPDALWGLLGLGAGWMVPTPGQKRRERVAASEGRLGGVVLAKDQNGGQGVESTRTNPGSIGSSIQA